MTTYSFKSLDLAERQGFDDAYFGNNRLTRLLKVEQVPYDAGYSDGIKQRRSADALQKPRGQEGVERKKSGLRSGLEKSEPSDDTREGSG